MNNFYARFSRLERHHVQVILRHTVDLGYNAPKIAENISRQLEGEPNQGNDYELCMNQTENDYLYSWVSAAKDRTTTAFNGVILDGVLAQLCPPQDNNRPGYVAPLQAGEDRQ